MTRRSIVTMRRNRIAFENMDHFPDDGNGQEHAKAAAFAWSAAANAVLRDRFDDDSESTLGYGNNSALHGPHLTVLVEDPDDGGEYEVDPTAEETAMARKIADEADEAGWAAAGEAMWNGG